MIELLDDPARFAEVAEPLLESRLEANLLATVLDGIRGRRLAGPPACFALIHGRGGELTAVALRTPPRPLLCTALGEDVDEFVRRWLTRDPAPPGVNATVATARAVAAAWARQTGGTAHAETARRCTCWTPRSSSVRRARPPGTCAARTPTRRTWRRSGARRSSRRFTSARTSRRRSR